MTDGHNDAQVLTEHFAGPLERQSWRLVRGRERVWAAGELAKISRRELLATRATAQFILARLTAQAD